jgi:outer membrane lipoprotein
MLVAGCAVMPDALQGNYSEELTPLQVSTSPETYKNATVRWGGVIVEIINNEQETWIEILSLPIDTSGRPYSNRQDNLGRFIAKTSQFLDPEVYQKGLMLTVTGTIMEPISGKVGERDYLYASVAIINHYLWPKRLRHNYYVVPGYWYYGYHPAWHFGYPFYGYGIWYQHRNYYPYFPVFGYMSRSQTREYRQYRTGDFSYARILDWSDRQRRWALSNIHYQVFPGHGRSLIRGESPRINPSFQNQNVRQSQRRATNNNRKAVQPSRASQLKPVKPYKPPKQSQK